MKKVSRIIALVIFSSIIIFIIYGQIRSYKYEKELNKNGKITIGRIDSIQVNPKRDYIYVSYYIRRKRYMSLESGLHKKISEKDIGKFYNIKYLPNSPGIIRGIYSKEIRNKTEILRAGFSIDDVDKFSVKKKGKTF